MNNRGFTLIELIATIALLAVISLISFVSVNKMIENEKISECNTLVKNIETATKEYASDMRYDNRFTSGFIKGSDGFLTKNIVASILSENDYLSGIITNPFNKEVVSPSDIKIGIKLYENYTVKEVTVYNSTNEKIVCENKKW